ncbi:MAG: lipopolysaccharide heptosyltransferase II [Alphaproteobacteria bacterium]|nr:lipopolysaccharide heptosyltransferase II [Alphaproteobacteria bacterium]
MSIHSTLHARSVESRSSATRDRRPILIVPYMWIGDFVRCHSVVKVLKARYPSRPVDVLSTSLCAPLVDYMPELRQAIVVDLPRKRLAYGQHAALAQRLKREQYGTALIMPRTWKSALAPFLAGIPERVGWFGEWRFGLLNDLRRGEKARARMIDQCAALALPADAPHRTDWPLPELKVPASEIAGWRERMGLAAERPAIALAPGAVGPSKRWPVYSYAQVARAFTAQGAAVWVLGGPGEKALATQIVTDAGPLARDFTGPDLRNAIVALAAADVAISNDSGLLHVAAALGVPSIGIFGPTSAWHWAPLNPIAAKLQLETPLDCQPCHKPICRKGHHRCMRDISPAHVFDVTARVLAEAKPG